MRLSRFRPVTTNRKSNHVEAGTEVSPLWPGFHQIIQTNIYGNNNQRKLEDLASAWSQRTRQVRQISRRKRVNRQLFP